MNHACTAKTHPVSKLLDMSDKALRDHMDEAAHCDSLRAVHLCYELATAQRQRGYDRPGLTLAVTRTLRHCAAQLALQL